MNRSRKEKVKEQLERLEMEEHVQVFSIIKKYTDVYTRTQNGLLVSSDNLPDDCIVEIEKYISFCMDTRRRMDDDAIERKAVLNRK